MIIDCLFYNDFRVLVYQESKGFIALLSTPNYYWRSPVFPNQYDPVESVKKFIDEVLVQ